MYNVSYFKEADRKVILEFLHEHPFAFITGSFNSGMQVATQIPVLVEERAGAIYVQGHIMRKTDHHKAFTENPQALIVFPGPHTYVSATWYSNPHMGSSWNYMSVHASGKMTFLPDEGLRSFMKRFTLRFENNNDSSPTIFDNLPDEYINKMLPGITAFEMKVEKMDNVFKLSQNRDEKSYRNIIEQLEKKGGDSTLIAAEMKKRTEQLFPPGKEWDESKFMS